MNVECARGLSAALDCFNLGTLLRPMIQDLKTSLDLLLRALNLRSEIKQIKNRRELIFDLLTAYFCLLQVVENGNDILTVLGAESAKRIIEMPEDERSKFTSHVYSLLITQTLLLTRITRLMHEQPILELLDPNFNHNLDTLTNKKLVLVGAMHASLRPLLIFDTNPTDQEVSAYGIETATLLYRARMIIRTFAGGSEASGAYELASKNLDEIKDGSERLRIIITEISTLEEQIELAKEAEKRARVG